MNALSHNLGCILVRIVMYLQATTVVRQLTVLKTNYCIIVFTILSQMQQLLFRQVKWPEEGVHRVAQEGTVVLVRNPHLFLLNPARDLHSLRKGKSFRDQLQNVSTDTSGADSNMYNAVLGIS